MEYTILRSDRRTLCIQINPEGEVIVRAPKRCAKRYIDEFVHRKSDWVQEHQQQVREQLAQRATFSLKTGDLLPFCGRVLTVKLAPGCRVYLTDQTAYLPSGDMNAVRKPLLAACQKKAYPWLKARLDAWAEEMGITYGELKCSSAASRWGSCSRDGVIRISVYLLLAPERAIDYVLIHELAHRNVFNHSRTFWSVVERYMPDWKYQRTELRALQQRLLAQGFYP